MHKYKWSNITKSVNFGNKRHFLSIEFLFVLVLTLKKIYWLHLNVRIIFVGMRYGHFCNKNENRVGGCMCVWNFLKSVFYINFYSNICPKEPKGWTPSGNGLRKKSKAGSMKKTDATFYWHLRPPISLPNQMVHTRNFLFAVVCLCKLVKTAHQSCFICRITDK